MSEMDPEIFGDKTNFGESACRLAAGFGFSKGPTTRGAVVLLIKGKGVGICATSDLRPQFENIAGENIVANFIRPATVRGDMDSAAFYTAAAMTVLLAPVIPSDGDIMRASANPGPPHPRRPFFFFILTILAIIPFL